MMTTAPGAPGLLPTPLRCPLLPADAKPLPPLAVAGVAVAVITGALTRLAVGSPLWLDEALSVNIADLPFGQIGDALRSEGHPPLYYWLLHAWMGLFGDGDAGARSLSAVLGVLALVPMWALGRRVGGGVVAAWSTVLLALSPYGVRYASEARMYSLLMLLVLVGAVLLWDALAGGSTGGATGVRLAGIAAVTGALIWTHYWSLHLLAVVVAGLLWWRRDAAGWRVLGAMAVGGLTFAPWLGRFVEQVRETGTPWGSPARPAQVLMDTISDLGTGGVDVYAEGQLLGVAVVVLVVVAVLATPSRPSPLALVTAGTLGLGAVAGYATGGAFNPRYAAVVVPFVLVLAAVGLTHLPPGWPRAAAALAVVGLGVVGAVKVDVTDRTEADDLAGAITAAAGPGDVVVACPDQLGVSLHRALAGRDAGVPVLPYPDVDGDPRFIEWRDYEARNDAVDIPAVAAAVDARAAGAVWVVYNPTYRTFTGDCEAFVAALSALRGGAQAVGEVQPERAYEHGDLLRFPAG